MRYAGLAGGAILIGLAATRSPLAALVVVVGAAAAIAVWRRPVLGGVLLLGAAPALSGLRRGLPIPTLRLSEAAILALSLLVLARIRGPRLDRIDGLAIAYAGSTLVLGAIDLLLIRAAPIGFEDAQTLAGPIQFLLLYRTCRVALADERAARLGLRMTLLASAPVALAAVAQLLDLGPSRTVLARITSGDPYGQFGGQLELGAGRATGPFEHPHTLAAYLMVVLLIAVALTFERRQEVLPRPALVTVIAIATAGLVASATAAPILATLAGAIWLGIRAGRRRRTLTWALGATVVAGAVASPLAIRRARLQYADGGSFVPQTLRYRLDVWQDQYLPALRGHWLWGYGPGVPPRVTYAYTESLYLTLVLRGGVLLLAIYGALIWAVLGTLRRVSAAAIGERRAVGAALIAATVLLVPLHLIEPYWVTTGSPHLWWALLGLVLAPVGVRATEAARGD